MRTAREIIAEQVCAEVNDVSFGELPEAATYLERKTHIHRPILDKQEALVVANGLVARLAAEGFSIVETEPNVDAALRTWFAAHYKASKGGLAEIHRDDMRAAVLASRLEDA